MAGEVQIRAVVQTAERISRKLGWNGRWPNTGNGGEALARFSVTQLPHSFAPRDRRPPKRNCSVLQRKPAFQL